ncbi:MAG: rod shape-determining protein [Lachnospiraceae bacterium]|nr:rod shape-determining protein [Lachnospiraceae bacterium]
MKKVNAPTDLVFYKVGEGELLREKALLAVNITTNEIAGVGDEAEAISGSSENIMLISPFHFGSIGNYTYAKKLIDILLQKAFGKHNIVSYLQKPVYTVCFDDVFLNTDNESYELLSEVNKKVYQDIFFQTGAKKVELFDGSAEKYLSVTDKKILSRITGIIEVTNDDKDDYAIELIKETIDKLKKMGYSKQDVCDIIKEL